MTSLVRVVPVALAAGALATASAASPPHYAYRYVAFVAVAGHGNVRSIPRGIDCPGACRVLFPRGTHLTLRATAAPGWRFAGFATSRCNDRGPTCVFDLVTSHDCVGGACPMGAFGVRARFVRR